MTTSTYARDGTARFKVSDVPVSAKRLQPLSDDKYIAEYWLQQISKNESGARFGGGGFDALMRSMKQGNALRYTSPKPEHAVTTGQRSAKNMFAQAVLLAYSDHLPLRLSPDAVWFTIAQGLARHINENSEALRSKFVSHEGKDNIEIVVPGNFKDDDWPKTLPVFESEISRRTLDSVSELIVASFSTSTALSTMCTRVTLMDAMKSYFEYTVRTRCGIPEVSLAGTVEDWKSVRERASRLAEYDLGWWTPSLLSVLDEFVKAAEGKPNAKFFQKMVSKHGGRRSGEPVVYTGWFQVFFPYIVKDEDKFARNPYLGKWKSFTRKITGEPGLEQGVMPSSLSAAPFIFDDTARGGRCLDMEFLGGLTCVTQDADSGTVEAQFGMAVVERGEHKA